jgi:hypothetical protein
MPVHAADVNAQGIFLVYSSFGDANRIHDEVNKAES